MPEAIISASGAQYGAAVDETNRLLVRTEGISVGSISLGSVSVATGSQSWIQNFNDLGSSVIVTNFGDLGSTVVVDNLYTGSKFYQGEVFGVSGIVVGSITSMPAVSVTAGSEQWIQNTVEVSGAVDINNFGDLGSSVVVTNFGDLGSSVIVENFNDLGSSIVVTNFNDIGSSSVITNFGDLGSVVVVDNFGDLGSNITGSVYITNSSEVGGYAGSVTYQGEVWGVSGIVEISNTVTGSIVSMPAVSVTAGSEQWIKNELVLSNVGSPCYKQATAIASGTYTQAWSIGGAGSRVEIHGYHISTNLPGIVNIVGSATAPILINTNYLNFASGAMIEKTFVSPVVPMGADIPIGFQSTSAGSTAVTIYGREVK